MHNDALCGGIPAPWALFGCREHRAGWGGTPERALNWGCNDADVLLAAGARRAVRHLRLRHPPILPASLRPEHDRQAVPSVQMPNSHPSLHAASHHVQNPFETCFEPSFSWVQAWVPLVTSHLAVVPRNLKGACKCAGRWGRGGAGGNLRAGGSKERRFSACSAARRNSRWSTNQGDGYKNSAMPTPQCQ